MLPGDSVEKFRTIQDTIFTIGCKWRYPIIYSLCDGPQRFNTIIKTLKTISAKTLTAELKELELHELVVRRVRDNKKVLIEYELTEHANSLRPLFEAMFNWGKLHRSYITKKSTERTTEKPLLKVVG
jgi:DNA-binding HxlR family transcriptional regulator